MINYDDQIMANLVTQCQQTNEELLDAQNLLYQIQSHNDWCCKEKSAIDEYMNTCKKELTEIVESQTSLLNAIKTSESEWNNTMNDIIQLFSALDLRLQNLLSVTGFGSAITGSTKGVSLTATATPIQMTNFDNLKL